MDFENNKVAKQSGPQQSLQALFCQLLTVNLSKQLVEDLTLTLHDRVLEAQHSVDSAFHDQWPETLKLIEFLWARRDEIERRKSAGLLSAMEDVLASEGKAKQTMSPVVPTSSESESVKPQSNELDAGSDTGSDKESDSETEPHRSRLSAKAENKVATVRLSSQKLGERQSETMGPQEGRVAEEQAESGSESGLDSGLDSKVMAKAESILTPKASDFELDKVFEALGPFKDKAQDLRKVVSAKVIRFIDMAESHWNELVDAEKTAESAVKLCEKVLKSLDRLMTHLMFDPLLKTLFSPAQDLERTLLKVFETHGDEDSELVPLLGRRASDCQQIQAEPCVSRVPEGLIIAVLKRGETSQVYVSAGDKTPFSNKDATDSNLRDDVVALLRGHMGAVRFLLQQEFDPNEIEENLKQLKQSRSSLRKIYELPEDKRRTRIQYALNVIYAVRRGKSDKYLRADETALWDQLEKRGWKSLPIPSSSHFDESFKDKHYEAVWTRDSDKPEGTILRTLRPGIVDSTGGAIQRVQFLVSEGS